MKPLFFLALTSCLGGCLPPPTVPVTPLNASQVAACQGDTTGHTFFLGGGMLLGVAGTTIGSVSALDTNPNTRTELAVTTAILGGLAAVSTVLMGLEASAYSSAKCSDVVGPLPVGK